MKLEDIAFLDVPLVVLMHDRISLSHGTALGVREPHTLAALVEGPKANAENGYLTNIAQVAASYAFGLATTQCFFDGAKRTAVLAMKSFLEEQGGLCAICNEAKATHLDHSHATGKVRGILCMNCNAALGSFRDSEKHLMSAIEYLRRNV